MARRFRDQVDCFLKVEACEVIGQEGHLKQRFVVLDSRPILYARKKCAIDEADELRCERVRADVAVHIRGIGW